jgi:hypothetical protein
MAIYCLSGDCYMTTMMLVEKAVCYEVGLMQVS